VEDFSEIVGANDEILEVSSINKRFDWLKTFRFWTISLLALTLVISSTALYLSWGPFHQYKNTDPNRDGYVQPRSIMNLVDSTQASTATIYCDTKKFSSQGSGWALAINTDYEKDYPTALVTNHHVIKDCLNGGGTISVKKYGGKEYEAVIDNWDEKSDLAVVATKLVLKPLELSPYNPLPGYWVMAVGTADGYEGSIAMGNVLNVTTDNYVLTTTPVSHGNSGGPLIDNLGHVIGTVAFMEVGAQYNGAISLDAMCKVIMKCNGNTFWNWGNQSSYKKQ
jgi:serine protease Do